MRLRVLLANAVFFCSCGCFQDPPPERVVASDEPIIRAALDSYGKSYVSDGKLPKNSDVAVVHLPNRTCVEIRAAKTTGDRTMCFDKARRLVLSYKSGS